MFKTILSVLMIALATGFASPAMAKGKGKAKGKTKNAAAHVEKKFNKIDADHNGSISLDEFKANKASKAAHHAGKKGAVKKGSAKKGKK